LVSTFSESSPERDVAATAAAPFPDGEADELQAVEDAIGEVQLGIGEFAGRVRRSTATAITWQSATVYS
jgi:hypothetical protein